MGSNWNPNSLGQAAAVATPLGAAPNLGAAYDLATAGWISQSQFNQFVRDVSQQHQAATTASAAVPPSLHDQQLAAAQNYASGQKGDSWFHKALSVPEHAFSTLEGIIAGGATEDSAAKFNDFKKNGGLLTQDEFNQFDPNTQLWLIGHVSSTAGGSTVGLLKDAAGAPGISQAMTGLNYAYRGMTAAAQLNADAISKGQFLGRWLSPDAWSQAWRESSDESLGNAMVNQVLQPFVSTETLDNLKKHSSLYQATSFLGELAATWYADPSVIAGKALGSTARIAKNAMPLNESSSLGVAMRQGLQRETITVRNPIIKAVASARVNRMDAGMHDVFNYAKVTNLSEFTGSAPGFPVMKMAVDRQSDGYALLRAVHIAANDDGTFAKVIDDHAAKMTAEGTMPTGLDLSTDGQFSSLGKLTQRLGWGDPKAWAFYNSLKKETPDALRSYSPNAQSFIDAMDGAKNYAGQLEREAEQIQRKIDWLDKGGSGTLGYYRWDLHTSLQEKMQELATAQATLKGYEGFDSFLNTIASDEERSLAGGAVVGGNPLISQAYVPKRGWSAVARKQATGQPYHRFFGDSQYGMFKTVVKAERATQLQRANMINAHDLNSGPMSFSRQAKQFEQLFDYRNPEALDQAVNDWFNARTGEDRIRVAAAFEEQHLIAGLTQKLNTLGSGNIDEAAVRAVYERTVQEQNRVIRNFAGTDSLYDPTIQGGSYQPLEKRLADEASTIKVVDDDGEYVTLNLMDNGRAQTVKVPSEMWQEKVTSKENRPNSITQGANYYMPMNAREFYLEMKRNADTLEMLDASELRQLGAHGMEAVDWLGTKFNSLWKPWSLLRLGWPMRVLMDENLRALAVLGPLGFAHHYGPAYVKASGSAALAMRAPIKGVISRIRRGSVRGEVMDLRQPEEIALGPGPVRDDTRQTPNQADYEAMVQAAPKIPERLHEKVNLDRLGVITDHATSFNAWKRSKDKANAWARALAEAKDTPEYEVLRAKAQQFGINPDKPLEGIAPKPTHPMDRILAADGQVVVRDIRGTGRIGSGYVIPLPNTTVSLDGLTGENAVSWYEHHADMLAKPSHRIVVDRESGTLSVGRHFNSNRLRTKNETGARDYHQHIDDSYPGAEMLHLADGGASRWTLDPRTDVSPLVDGLLRDRLNVGDTVPTTGSTLGKGLYTVAPDGTEYTLRNGRVWDADRQITPEQADTLHQIVGVRNENLAEANTADAPLRTWGELLERTQHTVRQQEILSLLQSRYGVKAITRLRDGHRVHVWLDPANTHVLSDGQYRPLADHLADLDAVEQDGAHLSGDLPDTGNPYDTFDAQIDDKRNWAKRALLERQGRGQRRAKSSDGKEAKFDAAYEGKLGDMLYAQTASDKAIDSISGGHGMARQWTQRQAIGHKVYRRPEFSDHALKAGTKENKAAVEYFGHWADLVNNQIGNDPIYEKMLRGWNDDKIVDWLTTTESGADVRNELMHEGRMPEVWVNEHRYRLNYYLPNQMLQRKLLKQRLDPSDLRRHIADENMPDVFGPELDALKKGTQLGRFLSRVVDGLWYGLGQAPIDALSHHPFAKAHYDLKMRSLIKSTNSDWLTPDTITRYQDQARKFALNETRRHLWDLVDNTNFTEALRFIAPFWNAQQEALVKWARIVTDRPETVGRLLAGNRAVYNNFLVVDDQGVPTGYHLGPDATDFGPQSKFLATLGYHPNDRVIVNMPELVKAIPGVGSVLQTVGSLGIPIGSANTVIQGEFPLFPGLGPMMTIPMDKFLRLTNSDAAGAMNDRKTWYRWFFPVGRPTAGPTGVESINPFDSKNWENLFQEIAPGYAKRLEAAGSDGPGWTNTLMSVGRELTMQNADKGLPPPTSAEIRKQAIFLQGVKVLSSILSPVQTEFRPDHQFFIDTYRAYQQQYGSGAMDKFIADFGDQAAIYVGSSSTSPVGVPATDKGMAEWHGEHDLFNAYALLPDAKTPGWGSALISPDAQNDQFNSDAYYAQGNINISDTSNEKMRQFPGYDQRMASAETQLGWYKYRQFSASVQSIMQAQGLTSLQQTGAEQLALAKQNFRAQLAQENPAWATDYNNQSNQIDMMINQAMYGTPGVTIQTADGPQQGGWAWDKRFDGRPDIQGFRQYLVLREQVASELDRNRAAGGSASLQSQENTPLRQWFEQQIGALVQANPAFADFYNRWLDADLMQSGTGGYGNGGS